MDIDREDQPTTLSPWLDSRCWSRDWVIDLDIASFFDQIDWGLLMRAVRQHADCKWVLLYLERWLKAPVSMPDGTLVSQERGMERTLRN